MLAAELGFEPVQPVLGPEVVLGLAVPVPGQVEPDLGQVEPVPGQVEPDLG